MHDHLGIVDRTESPSADAAYTAVFHPQRIHAPYRAAEYISSDCHIDAGEEFGPFGWLDEGHDSANSAVKACAEPYAAKLMFRREVLQGNRFRIRLSLRRRQARPRRS